MPVLILILMVLFLSYKLFKTSPLVQRRSLNIRLCISASWYLCGGSPGNDCFSYYTCFIIDTCPLSPELDFKSNVYICLSLCHILGNFFHEAWLYLNIILNLPACYFSKSQSPTVQLIPAAQTNVRSNWSWPLNI